MHKKEVLLGIAFLAILAAGQLLDQYTTAASIPPKKIHLELLLFFSLFLFVSFRYLISAPKPFRTQRAIFLLLAFFFFALALSDSTTLNQRLQYSLTEIHAGEMHFDKTSLLGRFGINTLSNSYWVYSNKLGKDDMLRYTFRLDQVPSDFKLTWLSS